MSVRETNDLREVGRIDVSEQTRDGQRVLGVPDVIDRSLNCREKEERGD